MTPKDKSSSRWTVKQPKWITMIIQFSLPRRISTSYRIMAIILVLCRVSYVKRGETEHTFGPCDFCACE